MYGRNVAPLVSAIAQNSYNKVEQCLKAGDKLQAKEFRSAFITSKYHVDSDVLDLLDRYDALPEGVSVSTIRFILFLRGNNRVHPATFQNKPDLNLNGCEGLPTPMSIAVRGQMEHWVQHLITNDVSERPIGHGYGTKVYNAFYWIDPFKYELRKKYIEEQLEQGCELEVQCRISELLMERVESFDDQIKEMTRYEYAYNSHENETLTPFFAWAAKNNKTNLFHSQGFCQLFKFFSKASILSIKVAALFDQQDYCLKAMNTFVDDEAWLMAIAKVVAYMAVVTGNQQLLFKVAMTLEKHGVAMKDIEPKAATQGVKADQGDVDPVFWSVRLQNTQALAFLLEQGFDPNNPEGLYEYQGSYLFIAARVGNEKSIKLLTDFGADIDKKNKLSGEAVLHEMVSYKEWGKACMLVEKFGASVYVKNKKGKTVLDRVKDPEMREKLRGLCKVPEPVEEVGRLRALVSRLTPGLFSSRGRGHSNTDNSNHSMRRSGFK